MPSILFINRVYPPDSGATGRVLQQVGETLAKTGWEVSVLASAGDRPGSGTVVCDGVKVMRLGGFFSKSSLLARAAGYALMIPSLLLKALILPRADVIVTMTDPPMLLVIGPILQLIRGSVLIHWAQDLYPEVAEEAGVFKKGGLVAGIIRALSTASLKSHDLVVSVGRCMSEKLFLRGIRPEKVRMIPNIGMERDIVPVDSVKNPFRSRNGIPPDALVVMYSGNLGRAHDFQTILEAARFLQEAGNNGVLILFVGEGPMRPTVEREAERAGLTNVCFLPSQPGSQISESLGAADLHLVTMKRAMSGLVVPSKFYGVLASSRPCLFIGPSDSEVARIIDEVVCGRVIEQGDGKGLAESILGYRNEPGRVVEEGKRGLKWLQSQPDVGTQFLKSLNYQKSL